MRKKLNKIIYILMIAILFIQSLSNVVIGVTAISKANLKNDHKITTNVQFLHEDGTWHNLVCNYIAYSNAGKKYPAYCIKHGVNGVDEEGSYTVKISELLSDEKIWRTIVNGYPYKTPEQLGVETADDAYVATKQAVNSVMLNRDVKSFYKGINSKGKKIVNAIYNISQIGRYGTQKMQAANLKINKISELVKFDDDWYYQEYSITSDVNISEYIVNSIKDFPKDSYISNSEGKKTTKFKAGDNFRVMIKKENIITDFLGIINVDADCKTYPIFFGKAPNSKIQDYAITYDSYDDFEVTEKFEHKVNTSKITVIKKDEETLEAIEGVKFQLSTGEGEILDSKATDSEGKIDFENLYPGNYILQELTTDENYILDTTEVAVELEFDTIIEKVLTNQHKKGNLKIIKVDKDDPNITLGGIEFELINSNNKVISKLTTNADGEACVENINIGNYVLKETKTKKEYNLCVDQDIIVKWNETSTITIENEKKKGQIKIIKQDKDYENIKLSGVEFEILDSSNRIIEKIVTDESGEALSSRLPIGEYKAREVSTKANIDYIVDKEIYNINIEDNKVSEVIIKNEHKKGTLKIYKVDKDNNKIPIENVKFEIMDEDGFKYYAITDKNGIAEVENIRIGKTKIIETETKKEYSLLKEILEIEIKENETTKVTIENEKKKGQIEVYKTDAEDNSIKIKGVVFEILNSNNNVVDKLITDNNGYAISKRIPIGTYYLKEVNTDEKYALNQDIKTVIIEDDEIVSLNITNVKKKGKIKIIKISSQDSPLLNIKKGDTISGVTFEIIDSENNVIDTLITNEQGEAISKDLEIGRYKIKEISTTNNFIMNSNEFFINIDRNNQIEEVKIENEPAIPKLDIEKTGPEEAYVNEEIKYDFNIKNIGNISLNNFTWKEYIPFEQVKITKMITGIYNFDLNYKVYYKTNKKDYRLLKEINSQKSEYIDFSDIKLTKNEIITELKIDFGTVASGFKSISNPQILVKIKEKVKNKESIKNKTDLTGFINESELKDESNCDTNVKERIIVKKLPRTGY